MPHLQCRPLARKAIDRDLQCHRRREEGFRGATECGRFSGGSGGNDANGRPHDLSAGVAACRGLDSSISVSGWVCVCVCGVGFSERMTSVACAVSPVGTQTAATPSFTAVSCSSSSSSSSASTSASFPGLPSFKAAASAFVAQQPLGSPFHGRRDSVGSTLNSSVAFDNGLFGSGRLRVSKSQCSPARALQSGEPLRIMISGAPASGKGTQCEMIVEQYNLAHIATGDLLRAEVAAGTEAGKLAQDYMQKGQLVPNDVVVAMVKNKLAAATNGWLLDGYPRSLSQAEALEALNIYPQIFILLEVPDEILVQRVAGRRLDPVTGKIYHLLYSPPETPEIAARLTQREDDTEEKVVLRLKTHNSNVQSVLDIYKPVMKVVDGNRPKDQVFADIKKLIVELQGEPEKVGAQVASGGL